jgi:hypothetical protein
MVRRYDPETGRPVGSSPPESDDRADALVSATDGLEPLPGPRRMMTQAEAEARYPTGHADVDLWHAYFQGALNEPAPCSGSAPSSLPAPRRLRLRDHLEVALATYLRRRGWLVGWKEPRR